MYIAAYMTTCLFKEAAVKGTTATGTLTPQNTLIEHKHTTYMQCLVFI